MTDENDTAEAVVTDDTPGVPPEDTPEVPPEAETTPPLKPNLCGGCAKWDGGKCDHFAFLRDTLKTDPIILLHCPERVEPTPPESPKE